MANNDKEKDKKKKKRPWWKRGFRILAWITSVLILLFVLLVLFIRSPWGQDIIVGQATEYIAEKTQTEFSIKKLFITFSGDIYLEGLYLEDENSDTLLYSESLQAGIPIWPIITGNPISIDGVEWNGLRANIFRKDTVKGFNFQFLIDAFTSNATANKPEKESSSPPKVAIGTIDLSDFKVNYSDDVNGMKAKLNLGLLNFEGKNFDLEKMKFEVAGLSLEDTQINYEQTKPIPTSSDTSKSKLPYLSLDELKLKNVIAHYKSIPDGIDAVANLSELGLQVPKADLNNQDIQVGNFILNNSNIKMKIAASEKVESELSEPKEATEKSTPFNWPDWNVQIESIALQNNHFQYQNGGKPENLKEFNPNYIEVKYFNFGANNIALSKKNSAQFNLTNLSFKENSGIALKQFALNASLDPTSITVDDLIVKTGNSSINADVATEFSSLQSLINNPEIAELMLDLNHFQIDLEDLFTFIPELEENEYLEKLSKKNFTGQINAKGRLSKMELSTLLVNWGQNTSIKTKGQFLNLTETENLTADINNLTFESNRADLTNIISEKELGISIPKTVKIESQFHGTLNDLKTQTQLIIPEGKIKVDGVFQNKNEIAFNANINVIDFELGKILNNPNIGTIAFEMKASGKGNTLNEMNAKLVSQFTQLEFNEYDFSALELDGSLDNGKGDVTICYKDKNLNLNIDSKIQLDSVSPKIEVDFNLEGADLMALGLTEKEVKTKLMMKANFEGNAEEFDFESHFSEGVAVYNNENYYLGDLDMSAGVTKDSTSFDINSNFINGNLRSNASPDQISKAIQQQLKRYFVDSIAQIDSIAKPIQLQMKLKLSETKLITDLLIPDIKSMDTLDFNIDFNQKENKLIANLHLPYLNYADNTIDSLQFKLNSTEKAAMFKFGFNELDADPFLMNRTYFDGELNNELLNLHFHAFNGEKEMYVVRSEITGKSTDLKIHFKPDELIFNGEDWSIPADNGINIQKDKIIANNFVFSRNSQSIKIANDLVQSSQNNIGIGFNNFKLANLLALFNKDNLLASGNFQGNIVAIDPFKNFGLEADFSIENLTAFQADLGKLILKANSENGHQYNLDLGVQGDDIDFAVKGDYSLQNKGSELDFNVALNKIGLKTIAAISGENLKDASGSISGEIAVQGNVSSPDYKGHLQFNSAEFNVSQLNTKFRLANDKIKIDNTDITLNQFSIEDEQKNTFTLDGGISTKSFSDPVFDLSVKAKNFQALNSTKEDNEEFYGDVNFDMTGTIKGNLSAPKVDMNIGINESTNFTYVIQDAQAKLEKREGIIEFVNKENPDNILTRNSDTTVVTSFGGIELQAKLNIDKGANFNVIIDPNTGDNLNISGVGEIDFNLEDNGRMTMSGRYEINDGHYSLSLYNLVKRRFELESGSYISWRGGGPMDADLNVTAKYEVEASASALMATQTAGASEEVKNKYRQRLPFFVFLNVNGELDQPILNFLLGMPEDSRGAIDGTVYGRIKQLNNEEDALNKQVFSLLVLKKFYPNSGSDGSNGGVANIARKNINEALSDQLNSFSDRLMGNTGVDLNFGLNSYTDYQGESAEQRTDLNVSAQKKLLDDRLIVQVGSTLNVEGESQPGEENAVVGNASIVYLLTEDGRWKLKGFRDNQYENVIDGQVFVNGVSIIFQRQFNKFNELLNAPPKNESSAEDQETDEEPKNKEEKTKSDKKEKN